MRKVCCLIFLSLCSFLNAQTAEKILSEYLDGKKKEIEFQVHLNYSIYKGETGTKVYESYDGVSAKLNNTLYQKLGPMEYIQGEDFTVKLNKEEKAIMISPSSHPDIKGLGELDNTDLFKLFDNKEVKDMNEYWQITLDSKLALLSQIGKIVLNIDKSSHRLLKQTIYYASVSDFSAYSNDTKDQDLGVARLEVTYFNYKNAIGINRGIFSKSKYFTFQEGKINTTEEFKKFELVYTN